ncbi:MAG TPA: lytic transglycosylase domain-containing protein [Chloroflexota bacterium]
MTNAPIIRSAALQRALAAASGRGVAPPKAEASSFAATLAKAQQPKPTVARPHGAPAIAADIGSGPVPFAAQIEAAAKKHGVDPALLAGLVKAESNFNPNARSGVGAKGLTQLMDATARGLGVTNSFDPGQALEGGAKFLGGLLKQFKGDERLALAAYNAGPGAVQKFGGIPPYQETQRYVPKVLGFKAQFSRIWADSNGTSTNA